MQNNNADNTASDTNTTENRQIVNLFDLATANEPTSQLEIIRISGDEQPVIPFTPVGQEIAIHWCDEPEIRGYAACSGSGCTLCLAGKRREERILLPMFNPIAQSVGVLLVSRSQRPGSLLPLLLREMGNPDETAQKVLFVRKDETNKFTVASSVLADTDSDGAAIIKTFLENVESGNVTLDSVIQKYTDAQLRAVPAIERRLQLKGGR